MKKMTVGAIIPTYNEIHTVEKIVAKTKKYVDEILVVDGHSTDGTIDLFKKRKIKFIFDNGKGKGAALRLGAKHVKTDIIVFLDADGSHTPSHILKLIAPIKRNEADMVIASRTMGGSAELSGAFDKTVRRFLSLMIDIIINIRFGSRITDAQNGFRAIKRSVFFDINLVEDIFSIEQEMVMKCLKRSYRIVDVPSYENARHFGKSNISLWRHGPRYFWCVLKNLW